MGTLIDALYSRVGQAGTKQNPHAVHVCCA